MRKSIFLGLCSLFCFAGCGKIDKPIEQNKDNNNNQQNNNEQTNKVDTEGKTPMVFVLAGQSNTEGNTQFDNGQGYLASALQELGIGDADYCYEGGLKLRVNENDSGVDHGGVGGQHYWARDMFRLGMAYAYIIVENDLLD